MMTMMTDDYDNNEHDDGDILYQTHWFPHQDLDSTMCIMGDFNLAWKMQVILVRIIPKPS